MFAKKYLKDIAKSYQPTSVDDTSLKVIISDICFKFNAVPPYFYVNVPSVSVEFGVHPRTQSNSTLLLKKGTVFVLKLEGKLTKKSGIIRLILYQLHPVFLNLFVLISNVILNKVLLVLLHR
jgi:hypothetical protein